MGGFNAELRKIARCASSLLLPCIFARFLPSRMCGGTVLTVNRTPYINFPFGTSPVRHAPSRDVRGCGAYIGANLRERISPNTSKINGPYSIIYAAVQESKDSVRLTRKGLKPLRIPGIKRGRRLYMRQVLRKNKSVPPRIPTAT